MSAKYERVVKDGLLETVRLEVPGGHLYLTLFDDEVLAQSFVPATSDVEHVTEGLSDVSRARLKLEQALNTASGDRRMAYVNEALALLGGPLL